MIKVLYVEDDAINALIIKKILGSEVEVTHVLDSESCLETIKKEKIDVVLMDINLGYGERDGVETLRQIKLLDDHHSTPVIALTSHSMPGDKRRFLNDGFDFYIAKPVERDSLIREIKKLANRQ